MVNFATKIRGHKSKERRKEKGDRRLGDMRLETVTGLPISLQWYKNPILNIAPSR